LSGNSEEGAALGGTPIYSDIHSIPQRLDYFNRESFDIRLLKKVKGSNGQYTALCPAHDDRAHSLSVKITDDRVLLHCFAGCQPEDIMKSLELPMSALFLKKDGNAAKRQKKPRLTATITYDYLNPDGSLAYRKNRYEYENGTKTFAFFGPGGQKGVNGIRRVPFNLPAVIAADTVYFTEGEKAASAVIEAGRAATSLDAGANSKWLPEYAGYFEGKSIIILPDNDSPGLKYAQKIAKNLPGAKIKKLPGLPEKGDVFDWLAAGRTMEDIDALPDEPLVNREYEKDEPVSNFLPDEPGFNPINPFTNQDRDRYRWNDIGISNLFADCYKNLSRYVPETRAWYVYDGRVWRNDIGGMAVAGQAKKFMYYLLISCQEFIDDDDLRSSWVDFVVKRMKKQSRDSMIADASSCWPVSIQDFDKDPYIFNCQNLTVDLRTFSVHTHSPEDFLSKISNVVYDDQALCGRWESFIGEIMEWDAEKAGFLQKALGYALTGDTKEECFFILYGNTTRNGKGTTMETALNLMGDYGRTAQPETVAQKQITHGGGPSEDIARLKGARFVNMSEPDKGLRLNASLVKQLTGGDTVTARFLNQNSFEYRPEYKLFINTNHLPRVSDDSIFASGRVKLIPFNRHFPENEQDRGLKSFFKQPGNVSGIFNWLIQGLRRFLSEGLAPPSSVKEATQQYRDDSDTAGQFINERLVKVPGHKVLIKDIHAQYEAWCGEYGYTPLNSRNLAEELRRKGLLIRKGDKNKTFLFDYGIAENQGLGG
jgi:P4 family phage/plasmid primase-like protien